MWEIPIVEFSDDAIISKDLNGTVQTWNKGAERVHGYSAVEMLEPPMSLFKRTSAEPLAIHYLSLVFAYYEPLIFC